MRDVNRFLELSTQLESVGSDGVDGVIDALLALMGFTTDLDRGPTSLMGFDRDLTPIYGDPDEPRSSHDEIAIDRDLVARSLLELMLKRAVSTATRDQVVLARARTFTSDIGALREIIVGERASPLMSLRIAEAFEVSLDQEQHRALATRVAAELRALAKHEKLVRADAAKLPMSAHRFGGDAGPVLRVLIEDEALQPFFADGAARLWLELDVDEGLPAALGVADGVNTMTLLALIARVDAAEAVEVVTPRAERDPMLAELLAGSSFVEGEDRWLRIALGALHTEPRGAVRLLARIGTDRAIEELRGVVAHAEVPAGSSEGVLDTALSSIARFHDAGRLAEIIADVVERPDGAAHLRRVIPYCYEHLSGVLRELRARGRDDLGEVVAAAMRRQRGL